MLLQDPVGISQENKYLFPRSSGLGHIEGHKFIRQFAFAAVLQHPERIGSRNMRKYIATVVQVNKFKLTKTCPNY